MDGPYESNFLKLSIRSEEGAGKKVDIDHYLVGSLMEKTQDAQDV